MGTGRYLVYVVATPGLAWPVVGTPDAPVRARDWPGTELRLVGIFDEEGPAFALFERLLSLVVPEA